MHLVLLICSLLTLVASTWAASITAGPMLGHVTSRTAEVWLQADQAAELRLEYWPAAHTTERRFAPAVNLRDTSDFCTHVHLDGLDPGTRYLYAVHLDGKRQWPAQTLQFSTRPLWDEQHAPDDFTVYLGSCAVIGDNGHDRASSAPTPGYEIFASLAALAAGNGQPQAMLWLGDNVRFRHDDLESPSAMNARYRHSRALPELQPLLRATPHYAIWDDHDYGPNDGNRSFVLKDASLDLFRRYWANPSQGLRDLPGNFTAFSLLDADFFLLDDRFYRASDATAVPEAEFNLVRSITDYLIGYNAATQVLGRRFQGKDPAWLGESKVMFGAAQLDWLKQALIQSTATFKFVVSGSQLFNDLNTFEGWQNFPEEREPFVQWLSAQDIPGVVFLSGDRRHTELIRRERKKTYPLYELTCSPLTATPHPPAGKECENGQRLPGTLVSQRNFCSLDVAGPATDRVLTLRSFDSRGRLLWAHSLAARELRSHRPDQIDDR